jgi:GTP-binding protein HflX
MHQELEKKIKGEIERQKKIRNNTNKSRRELNVPIVSLIGYTNVGKTSLIKYLTQDEKMRPENKLFATLDVTYHGMKLPESGLNVVLVDTIGFISDIPTNLIEAFRVTLQDALDADLFVHVLDATNPNVEAQEKVVLETLESLGAEKKIENMLVVFNKYDKLEDKSKIDALVADKSCLAVSCYDGQGIDDLLRLIEKKIKAIKRYLDVRLKVPQGGEELKFLYKTCAIQQVEPFEEDPQFVVVSALFDKKSALKFMKSFPSAKIFTNPNQKIK